MHAQILPSPRALCLFDPQGGHAPVGSTFRGRWPGDLFWRTGVCVCLYVCVCVCVCVCQVLRYMFGTLVSVSALCWAPQETVGTEARPQAPRSALFYEP